MFIDITLQATYTAQIKGWQSADDHISSMYEQNNEVMELSRIISQLAIANHQLANVHNATLTRMEALYLELSKAKENRKQTTSREASETYDDILSKKLQNTDESIKTEETRRLEQRIVRLERLLAKSSAEECEQKNLQENSKLHFRIERLDSLTQDANNEDYSMRSAGSCCQLAEQRTNRIMIDIDNYDKDIMKEEEKMYRYCSAHSDDSEMNVPMVNKSICSSIDLDKVNRKWTRLRNNEHNLTTNNTSITEKILKLSEEIEKLTDDKLKSEKLLCNLADQKNLMEKLSVDYEV